MSLFDRFKATYARTPEVHVQDSAGGPSIRKRYCFSGYVQGVGFRYQALSFARQLRLTGWARNEPNGSVTVEVQGGEANVAEFLRVMREVPRFSITNIQTEDLPPAGAETSFSIKY